MSALGTKRTFQRRLSLSAVGPKQTKADFVECGLSANDPKRTFDDAPSF